MFNRRILGDISVDGNQVVNTKIMHAGMACDPGEHSELLGGDIKEVADTFGRCFYMEPFSKLRILGGDTYRAVAAAADPVLLAGCGDHGRAGDSDCIRPHSQSLGKIGGYPKSAGDDQRYVGVNAVQVLSGPGQGKYRRDRGGFPEQERTGTGCAAAAINSNKIRFIIQ